VSGSAPPRQIRSFVAIGDSFTEGLDDPAADGGYLGWADRLAAHLAAHLDAAIAAARSADRLRYANLAIRGKLLRQVLIDQLPVAAGLRADLVSFCAGGNDLLRPSGDPARLAALFETGVRRLRDAGSTVLMMTGFDPVAIPVLRRVRPKIDEYNERLRDIAGRYDCPLVDLWTMDRLYDQRAWSVDRLHLSAEGHRRIALHAAAALGVPTDADPDEPWPPAEPAPYWWRRRRSDVRWARAYLAPWISRRLRGTSSCDGRTPKRPRLDPL
jgi:lysophospholipase L1-like esterase